MLRTHADKAPSIGAFLFTAAFGLYVFTSAPSVTFWDSGELIAASHTLGISHQPGYPLFSLAAKAFSFIPAGSVAFRTNLLSGFSAALSVYLLYASMRLLLAGRGRAATFHDGLAAAGLAALFGASKVLWSQAVVTEVYGLNAFFITALVYTHILGSLGRLSPARYVALSGFLFGLGAVNHVTVGLLAPGLLVGWYLLLRVSSRRFTAVAAGLGFVLLGLSVLVYLPVRSNALPYINIGHPDTLSGFMWTVRWEGYLHQLMSLPNGLTRLAGAAAASASGTALVLCGLAVLAGAGWTLVRSDGRTYLPILVFASVYVPVTAAVALSSGRDVGFGLHEKFFIPAVAFGLVFASGLVGTALALHAVRIRYGIAALCIGACAYLVPANMPAADYHRHFIAHDYAMNSLKSAGERGVLLTWGDNGVFPLWYMQAVEKYRDDVLLAHTPLMTYGWYLSDINRRVGMDIEYMDTYFLGENVYRIIKSDPSRPFGYDYSSVRNLKLDERKLSPRGLVYFEGRVPPGDPWPYYVFRGVKDQDVPVGKLERNIIQIYGYMKRLDNMGR